jgi:hypothetical protein
MHSPPLYFLITSLLLSSPGAVVVNWGETAVVIAVVGAVASSTLQSSQGIGIVGALQLQPHSTIDIVLWQHGGPVVFDIVAADNFAASRQRCRRCRCRRSG